jgi:hypothetical protein
MALVSAAAAGTVYSSEARANGRFPESNQIVFSAQDPDLILLRVTFGLLISRDRGRTFDWVCEQSIGFSGVEDPMYTVMPSGGYMGTTFQGVTLSQDRACNWRYFGGDLAEKVFIDLSADPNDGRRVVVFASSYDKQDPQGNILFDSRIWETRDEGVTFQPLGAPLDPGLLGYTIDLTASDPARLYATAVRDPGVEPKAFLLTSKDRGQSWEELAIPLVDTERSVFVAAVDPHNAERVYLRTSNSPDRPTRLLLRDADPNGGAPTIRTLYTALGGLLGFALGTGDNKNIYIGGPKDGLLVANVQDYLFEQRSKIEIQCLGINSDGLWACSNEPSGFIAGVSSDDGRTFAPRLHFCSIRGPLACNGGSATADKCTGSWPAQRSLLGCDSSAVDGGGKVDFVDGGAITSAVPLAGSGSNCNCRQTTAVGPWGAALSIVGGAVAFWRRKRRLVRKR